MQAMSDPLANAALAAAVYLGIATLIGLYIRRRVIGSRNDFTSAKDYGRAWAGYAAFVAAISSIPRALQTDLANGLGIVLVALFFFSPVAFAAGWTYGTVAIRRRSAAPASSATEQGLQDPASSTTPERVPLGERNPVPPADAPSVGATQGAHCINPQDTHASEAESLWAQALTEFESSSRRLGLWARSLAESNGNESVAKAAYLRARVSELANKQ